MGGDQAPEIVIQGAELFLQRDRPARVLLFGDQDQLKPLLKAAPLLSESCEIFHTSEAVSMSDKPGQVLRKGRQTSMWLAVNAVHEGRAQAIVSAGNTGALMALAKFQLRTMPGIDRPALGTVWPTRKGQCVILDVGANIEATAKQLADFAMLGWAFARTVLNQENPEIAILNIGSEELKGPDVLRDAAAILRDERLGINFTGFVEGNDLTMGRADVVVTDGFTGNVALKTAEGTARMLAYFMRAAFHGSMLNRLGGWIASGAFRNLKNLMDPNRINGGVFLGLNGIVVKSHGAADSVGFASALDLAASLAGGEFSGRISESLSRLNNKLGPGESDHASPGGEGSDELNTGVATQNT